MSGLTPSPNQISRKTMKYYSVVLISLLLAQVDCHADFVVDDPVSHFLEQEILIGSLYKDNQLLKISVDMNEDNKEDIFLSTTSKDRVSGKVTRKWDVYLSVPNGYLVPEKNISGSSFRQSIDMPPTPKIVRLEEADNRKVFVNYIPSSARSGTWVVEYISKDNRPVSHVLGSVRKQFIDGEFRDPDSNILIPTDNLPYKFEGISLDRVLDQTKLIKLKNWGDTFWGKHYLSTDPSDRSRSLVFDRKTNELVGHKIRFGEFIPINDNKLDYGDSTRVIDNSSK